MEDEQQKELVQGPVIRPEDLTEFLDKEIIPSTGIDLTIKEMWGGETKYGYRYKVSTVKGEFFLNKTSLKKMASAYGNNTAAWVGKGIRLVVVKVSVRGELKDSIMAEPV